MRDYTCLSLNGWRALSVDCYFLSIKINKIFQYVSTHGYKNWEDNLFQLNLTGTIQCHYFPVCHTAQLMFHDCTAQYLTSHGHNYTKMIRDWIGQLYIFWNGNSNKAVNYLHWTAFEINLFFFFKMLNYSFKMLWRKLGPDHFHFSVVGIPCKNNAIC